MDQTLQPDDQMWVDIGKLIRNQVPDKDGKTLPSNLNSGSYELRDLANTGAGTLFEGKVTYDKMYGHAAYGCALCCGYGTSGYGFFWNPLGIPDDGTADQGVEAPNECDGGDLEDVSDSFYGNWTTGNSSIATVDHYGTHTGVSIDSTTSNTHGQLNDNDVPRRCPLFTYNPSGNDNTLKITSVSPNPVVLGSSGSMTISGSGLSGKGTPTVQFSVGGITTSSVTVVNDSTVTANYTVSCSATSQNIYLQFPSFDNAVSNQLPLTVGLPAAPAPNIQFGGNNVGGTTQSVEVGQQIALTASVPSLPACMSLSSQAWSTPPGTAVGGYTASTSSGSVTALPTNTASSYTFYWVYPQNSMQMTYQYVMAGGGGQVTSPAATVTFNATGPTGGTMVSTPYSQVTIDALTACGQITAGPYLVYGNIYVTGSPCYLTGTPGMSFNPSGYSNSSGGTWSFVQLISSGSDTGGKTCTIVAGVDTIYPYGTSLPETDAPATLLQSTWTSLTRSLTLQMYLLWTPNQANAIPVPLGYQQWGFSGSAHCTTSCASANNWAASTQSAGTQGGFVVASGSQANQGYPTWSTVSSCQ